MDNKKDKLHHFSSNIITILNLKIENSRIHDKEKILCLLQVLGMLTTFEDLLVKRKYKIFKQKKSLTEILNIISLILQKRIRKNKVKIIIPKEDFYINIDQYHFQEALKAIIDYLLNAASKIKFEYKKRNKELKIIHNAEFKECSRNLYSCLKTEFTYDKSINCKIATMILDFHKIKMQRKKGEITLNFSEQ